MDDDRDDTVIRPPAAPSAAPGAVEPDTDDTIVRGEVPAASLPEIDRDLTSTPRIDHATGLPVLPDLLVVPRAPDTEPIQVIGYALRVAGELVPLDREVLVGRNPVPPRIQQGPAPRLVAVPSPTSDVSRTHVSVRQLGGSVIVTDLRSTNGSKVEVPGSEPRALRQGDSVVVTVGTRIDIGDGNLLEVHRMQPPGVETGPTVDGMGHA
ncbi:MAG: FHA domain-containing protein [Actinomycetota bacterium]|nr:FHA domain-containing protein [Actinomycetota bacterium]